MMGVMTCLVPLLSLLAGCKDTASPVDSAVPPVPPGDSATRDVEQVPGTREPWLRDQRGAPGPAVFTELQVHPADGGVEWVELHNPMVLDLALTGWSLAGAVDYAFPDGAVLPAGGFLVVAAEPAALTDALGPWDGQLADEGERLDLVSNSDRLIDTVAWGADDPWPVGAQGSGATLTKPDPDTLSDRAEHWTVSPVLGGTPGSDSGLDPDAPPTTRVLVPDDATWRLHVDGTWPGDDWAATDFDDSAWDTAQAPIHAGEGPETVAATAWVTADNYYAVYLGRSDGSDLRLVAEDADGDWTTVDPHDLEPTPDDHLFLAAWEAPGDGGTPQMLIGEVDVDGETVGTSAAAFDWVLGPPGDNPDASPPNPAPSAAEVAAVVADADADGTWEPPAVEADRSADPWGGYVSSQVSSAARFVWGDTFDSDSITNQQETWALFRSVDPLRGPGEDLGLDAVPVASWFRTDFAWTGDPDATVLTVACTFDDGGAVWLNGVELLRENLPAGDLDETTLAVDAVDDADLFAEVSPSALVQGDNVLAVAVHQASEDDPDLTFGCSLTAKTWPAEPAPPVVLSEVSAGGGGFQATLLAIDATADTEGLVLASDRGEQVLDADTWQVAVDFPVEAGDVLFLFAADRAELHDAVRVEDTAQAREQGTGPWRFPGDPSEDVVLHEVHPRGEWLELTNRGDEAIDLGGWQLVDAVAYTVPSGTTLGPGEYLVVAAEPDALPVDALGPYDGRLDNDSDRILLRDAAGNPADEVRYHTGGRWPDIDAHASLELRDPWADNAAPGAWAASDESGRAAWVDVSIRDVAQPSVVGPDGVWEELVLGLLAPGVVLIDDLSVVQDPDTNPRQVLQDGTFDAGADTWRLLGNHRHSTVVADPDDPSNPVLRLEATGPTGHMHNHAETTLLEPIGTREYEISFRARWVSGSPQLHSRLYFNRLPTTTVLPIPEGSGTPGEANSTAVDNLGPTFTDFAQSVAVPAPGEPVVVSVRIDDPDGVGEVLLRQLVEDQAAGWSRMTETAPGTWSATIDGQEAGTLVQVWVEAEDTAGASTTWPAAGPDSRALIAWDDGEAGDDGLHDLRILMTPSDSAWLHDDVNLMSNDPVGCTVVYRESEVFHDVGVRAKGSQRGRPQSVRLGYGLRFHADEPLRGVHTSVLIDRSEGVGYGQREVLTNLVMTHAGSVSGEHNDLVHLVAPRSDATGPAELQLDRFTDKVLAAQFEDGDAGRLFEYELIYYPYTTDDGTAEGLKLPQPDSVVGSAITDLGDDPEHWRWIFLVKNNRADDDLGAIQDLGRTFALGGTFLDEVDAVIDVDQWLRGFAFATLSGATDQYGGVGSQHNAQFYVRPSDGRVLFFPHDLDYMSSSSMAVAGNGDLARLLAEPAWHRAFYGHLWDIVSRVYTTDQLGPWCDQLGDLLPGQDFDGHCAFIDARADWVMSDSSEAILRVYPARDFRITTNGGQDFSVDTAQTMLQGEGWVDVRTVVLDGVPLELTWSDTVTWQVAVTLDEGENALLLEAFDHQGVGVGSASIAITRSGG